MTKLLFMGRKNVAAKMLAYCHSLDELDIVGVLTDNHLENSPTATAAENLNLPVYSFDDALVHMKSGKLQFDLGVSILYWRKLKNEFLSIPSKGIINFHPALLPEYKGTGGYNLAILEGLCKWGVSAHYVDKEIDTGRIIGISEFEIDPDKETVVSLEEKTMKILEDMAQKIILKAVSLKNRLPSKENIGGRYVSRNEMEKMKKIVEGDDIERKVRAFWFPPYDGAYITIDGKKYTLVSQDILKTLAPETSTSLFTPNS